MLHGTSESALALVLINVMLLDHVQSQSVKALVLIFAAMWVIIMCGRLVKELAYGDRKEG